MIPFVVATSKTNPKPIIVVEKSEFDDWLAAQSDLHQGWIDAHAFEADGGKTLLLPGAAGEVEAVLYVKDGDWNI